MQPKGSRAVCRCPSVCLSVCRLQTLILDPRPLLEPANISQAAFKWHSLDGGGGQHAPGSLFTLCKNIFSLSAIWSWQDLTNKRQRQNKRRKTKAERDGWRVFAMRAFQGMSSNGRRESILFYGDFRASATLHLKENDEEKRREFSLA